MAASLPFDPALPSRKFSPIVPEELADSDFTKSAAGVFVKFDPASGLIVTRGANGIKLDTPPRTPLIHVDGSPIEDSYPLVPLGSAGIIISSVTAPKAGRYLVRVFDSRQLTIQAQEPTGYDKFVRQFYYLQTNAIPMMRRDWVNTTVQTRIHWPQEVVSSCDASGSYGPFDLSAGETVNLYYAPMKHLIAAAVVDKAIAKGSLSLWEYPTYA